VTRLQPKNSPITTADGCSLARLVTTLNNQKERLLAGCKNCRNVSSLLSTDLVGYIARLPCRHCGMPPSENQVPISAVALYELFTCAVTKSSMKPWSGANTNRHLRSSGERNGEQRRTKVSFGRTMIKALELQRLVKRHISGWSDIKQWRNQAYSFSSYQVTLVWRHQPISQIVSQSSSRKICSIRIF